MPFVSQLTAEQIVIAPPWRGFGETVDGLLHRLLQAELLSTKARDAAASAVRAREAEASTAVLEIGVGVPHARIADLHASVVGLAIASAGLYDVAPMVPIRIVALVLSPIAALEKHLRTLADVATLLRSAELRALLLRATDTPFAIDVLQRFARSLP